MNDGLKQAVEEARQVLDRAVELYSPELGLACSFSSEDIVVLDILAGIRPGLRVFSLDTGRLNPETYECAEAVSARFGVKIDWYFPDAAAVEALERGKGVMSFRQSVENRKECCRIRKVDPLKRALSGLKAWVTGLRRTQSVTRDGLGFFEEGGIGGIVKVSPLANWDYGFVMSYIMEKGLPYNRLLDAGYKSIGCAPCTRAVQNGEDERAGRWWWEDPEHKECGLHLKGGRL